MTDPQRAERMWLAMALATWWLLWVVGEADNEVTRPRRWVRCRRRNVVGGRGGGWWRSFAVVGQ
jgi:hypothetical protein